MLIGLHAFCPSDGLTAVSPVVRILCLIVNRHLYVTMNQDHLTSTLKGTPGVVLAQTQILANCGEGCIHASYATRTWKSLLYSLKAQKA